MKDLAAFDFVARKKGRREFLLNYLNSSEGNAAAQSSDDESYGASKPSKEHIWTQGKRLGEMF